MLEIIFWEEISYTGRKYTRLRNHDEHINHCHTTWQEYPWQEWVHWFIHTLEMVPRNWYTSVELLQGTLEWEYLSTIFMHTFYFASEQPTFDVALDIMKENIFEEILVAAMNFHICSTIFHHWMECYNVTWELDDYDPLDINIPESKGMPTVE